MMWLSLPNFVLSKDMIEICFSQNTEIAKREVFVRFEFVQNFDMLSYNL